MPGDIMEEIAGGYGGSNPSGTFGNSSGNNENAVWSTIVQGASGILNTFADIRKAKISANQNVSIAESQAKVANAYALARTTAAPSGYPDRYTTRNPMPGMFSTYPQADTKPEPGMDGYSPVESLQRLSQTPIIWAIIGLFVFIAILGVLKKR